MAPPIVSSSNSSETVILPNRRIKLAPKGYVSRYATERGNQRTRSRSRSRDSTERGNRNTAHPDKERHFIVRHKDIGYRKPEPPKEKIIIRHTKKSAQNLSNVRKVQERLELQRLLRLYEASLDFKFGPPKSMAIERQPLPPCRIFGRYPRITRHSRPTPPTSLELAHHNIYAAHLPNIFEGNRRAVFPNGIGSGSVFDTDDVPVTQGMRSRNHKTAGIRHGTGSRSAPIQNRPRNVSAYGHKAMNTSTYHAPTTKSKVDRSISPGNTKTTVESAAGVIEIKTRGPSTPETIEEKTLLGSVAGALRSLFIRTEDDLTSPSTSQASSVRRPERASNYREGAVTRAHTSKYSKVESNDIGYKITISLTPTKLRSQKLQTKQQISAALNENHNVAAIRQKSPVSTSSGSQAPITYSRGAVRYPKVSSVDRRPHSANVAELSNGRFNVVRPPTKVPSMATPIHLSNTPKYNAHRAYVSSYSQRSTKTRADTGLPALSTTSSMTSEYKVSEKHNVAAIRQKSPVSTSSGSQAPSTYSRGAVNRHPKVSPVDRRPHSANVADLSNGRLYYVKPPAKVSNMSSNTPKYNEHRAYVSPYSQRIANKRAQTSLAASPMTSTTKVPNMGTPMIQLNNSPRYNAHRAYVSPYSQTSLSASSTTSSMTSEYTTKVPNMATPRIQLNNTPKYNAHRAYVSPYCQRSMNAREQTSLSASSTTSSMASEYTAKVPNMATPRIQLNKTPKYNAHRGYVSPYSQRSTQELSIWAVRYPKVSSVDRRPHSANVAELNNGNLNFVRTPTKVPSMTTPMIHLNNTPKYNAQRAYVSPYSKRSMNARVQTSLAASSGYKVPVSRSTSTHVRTDMPYDYNGATSRTWLPSILNTPSTAGSNQIRSDQVSPYSPRPLCRKTVGFYRDGNSSAYSRQTTVRHSSTDGSSQRTNSSDSLEPVNCDSCPHPLQNKQYNSSVKSGVRNNVSAVPYDTVLNGATESSTYPCKPTIISASARTLIVSKTTTPDVKLKYSKRAGWSPTNKPAFGSSASREVGKENIPNAPVLGSRPSSGSTDVQRRDVASKSRICTYPRPSSATIHADKQSGKRTASVIVSPSGKTNTEQRNTSATVRSRLYEKPEPGPNAASEKGQRSTSANAQLSNSMASYKSKAITGLREVSYSSKVTLPTISSASKSVKNVIRNSSTTAGVRTLPDSKVLTLNVSNKPAKKTSAVTRLTDPTATLDANQCSSSAMESRVLTARLDLASKTSQQNTTCKTSKNASRARQPPIPSQSTTRTNTSSVSKSVSSISSSHQQSPSSSSTVAPLVYSTVRTQISDSGSTAVASTSCSSQSSVSSTSLQRSDSPTSPVRPSVQRYTESASTSSSTTARGASTRGSVSNRRTRTARVTHSATTASRSAINASASTSGPSSSSNVVKHVSTKASAGSRAPGRLQHLARTTVSSSRSDDSIKYSGRYRTSTRHTSRTRPIPFRF